MYTGYVYEDIINDTKQSRICKLKKTILDNIDVLVDGPYKEELKDIAHCPFRGSTNQRLITLVNRTSI